MCIGCSVGLLLLYIANQSSFSSINDKDLHYYRNLTNLTVTNSRLTYVSRLAFQNNLKLQYLNLKDNNLSSLSWRIFRHLNISNLILSGNPLHCSCENIWMKLWLGEEADAQDLQCTAEGGGRKPLTRLKLPHCKNLCHGQSFFKVSRLEQHALVSHTQRVNALPTLNSIVFGHCLLYRLSTTHGRGRCRMAASQPETLSTLQPPFLSVILSVVPSHSLLTISLPGNLSAIFIPPNISKLSDAYQDHHWCIPFSMSGNPKPELRWLLDGEPVIEGPYIMTMIHDFSEREYHGCLQLDSPTHINNGPYTLLASNKYGQDRKTVNAHFMHNPFEGDDTPLDPPEDRVAVSHTPRHLVAHLCCVLCFV
ncbi:unnamed protein product [Oncorhynchus mykiss]|uniref:Ig-like domain-containing protein n=1 Tax=Oncorhynchus mykiss TaxID=8022 RepID=A0A060WQD4_ONCMY|nr:unnamed protein product [Oncorhynchus mykiss]